MSDHKLFSEMMEIAKGGIKNIVEEKKKEVPMSIFIIVDGKITFTQPPHSITKDDIAIVLEKMREHELPYCFVSEAWSSTCPKGSKAEEIVPSKDPERKEVVFIQGNFLGDDVFLMAYISTDKDQRKLGEWECQQSVLGRFSKENF